MAAVDRVALALSDPIRLQILDLLAAGRGEGCCSPNNPEAPVALCSCDILPVLGLAPTKLSYHMKELREAGLVEEQKRGRWVYFSLNRGALAEFSAGVLDRFVVEKERPKAACCAPPLMQLDELPVE